MDELWLPCSANACNYGSVLNSSPAKQGRPGPVVQAGSGIVGGRVCLLPVPPVSGVVIILTHSAPNCSFGEQTVEESMGHGHDPSMACGTAWLLSLAYP